MEGQVAETGNAVRELSLPIHESKGWLKFLGIMNIVYGVFSAITVVGILVAWLPIWIGILLWQCATTIERAQASGNKQLMLESLGKLKTYFIIQGIMGIIGIVGILIAMSFGILGAILGLMGMGY
jgi:hypothetical protein